MGKRYLYLRRPRHAGFAREYYAAKADNRLNPGIPRLRLSDHILLQGSWVDIFLKEIPFRSLGRKPWKRRRSAERTFIRSVNDRCETDEFDEFEEDL